MRLSERCWRGAGAACGLVLLVTSSVPHGFSSMAAEPPGGGLGESLVQNGGFERPELTGSSWEWIQADTGRLEAWTVGGGPSGGVDLSGTLWTAGEGKQSLDLAGWGPGWISQVMVTEPGRTYDLSFLLAGNYAEAPATKVVEVVWNGTSLGQTSFDTTGRSATSMGWQRMVFPRLRAGGTGTELRLIAANSGTAGPAIDDIRVVPAAAPPESVTGLVVPPRYRDRDDTDGSSDALGNPITLQNVYAAAHFTEGPILIREVRFRRDAVMPPFTAMDVDLRLTLSTTLKPVEGLSPTFAENLGPDATVGFDGHLTLASESLPGSDAAPAFELLVPLTTPFAYDPAQGNLLCEVRTRSASEHLWTDASNDFDEGASRVFAYGASAEVATFLDTGADIINLRFELLPLPLRLQPRGGYFHGSVELTMTSGVEGATIHYTTDGSEPGLGSPVFQPPLVLTNSAVVKARTFKGADAVSPIVTETYLEQRWDDGIPAAWRREHFGAQWFAREEAGPVADPDGDHATNYQEWMAGTSPTDPASRPDPVPSLVRIDPAGGEYEGSVLVTLTCGVAGAGLRYSLDGTAPSLAGDLVSSISLGVSSNTIVKAQAFWQEQAISEIVSAEFQVQPIPPVFLAQPREQTVTEGGSARFEVLVKGTWPFSFQWFRDGVPLAVTSAGSVLTIEEAKLSDAGAYTVRVSNVLGEVTSAEARLTVLPAPVRPFITRQPESQSVPVGGTATFQAEVGGDPPLQFEWRRGGLLLAGERGPQLVIENVQKTNAGSYRLRIWNNVGSAYTLPVTLTVTDQPVSPSIQSGPVGALAREGDPANLSVVVSGSSPFGYQWYRNGQAIPGATTSRLAFAASALSDAGTYWVTVSNVAGVATSEPAILEVQPLATGVTVVFDNFVPSKGIDAPVRDADGSTRLEGPAYLAQLYVGTNEGELRPAGAAVPFRKGSEAGYVVLGPSGNLIAIPEVPPGAMASVQVRAWETARGASFETALRAGGKTGKSEVLQVTSGGVGDPATIHANLVGLQGFVLQREQEPPLVTLTSPAAGTTADERFELRGQVQDAISLGEVRWSWNGQDQGPLSLDAEGQFVVPGLRLVRGANLIEVQARDAAGNVGRAEVSPVWEPPRRLALTSIEPVREGRRAVTTVTLESRGEVSGMTVVVRYDPGRFQDAQWTWLEPATTAGALSQVSTGIPGEVRATFSLPGATVPEGIQALATLSLRARSVPGATTSAWVPEFVDVADSQGAKFGYGNTTDATSVQVVPRRWVGDHNGNDRLDVGDASLIQRLIAGLDPTRSWDIPANDLNQSADLDSGDVIKVLRVLVGLDPAPGWIGPALADASSRGGATLAGAAPGLTALSLTSSRSQVWPGATITVRVNLEHPPRPMSGASFRLRYPADRLRPAGATAWREGTALPTGVHGLWNVDATSGLAAFAVAAGEAWGSTGGLLAELDFEVLGRGGPTGLLTMTLDQASVSTDLGWETVPLPDFSLALPEYVPGLEPSVVRRADGWEIGFNTVVGVRYRLEASEDLDHWELMGSEVGTGGLLKRVDPDGEGRAMRFYRLRLEP